jgi:hypothetical protein
VPVDREVVRVLSDFKLGADNQQVEDFGKVTDFGRRRPPGQHHRHQRQGGGRAAEAAAARPTSACACA